MCIPFHAFNVVESVTVGGGENCGGYAILTYLLTVRFLLLCKPCNVVQIVVQMSACLAIGLYTTEGFFCGMYGYVSSGLMKGIGSFSEAFVVWFGWVT